jgi:hypothetical protein
VAGTQDNACGVIGGGACTDCTASNQTCRGRQCVDKCGPANCAGCCLPNNTCDPLGINNNACGQGGAACVNCNVSGSFCNGLVMPRRCNNQQSTCPASYGACPVGTTMPITPQLQNLCDDASLETLTLACAAGPKTPTCVAAFAALPAACQMCLQPFNFPFEQRTGLYACAASAVNNNCRRAMGCAADCVETSCEQCLPTSQNQCFALVNGNGGQCGPFSNAANCASAALAGGLCSQFSYANFGAWLRGVGDQFCGNGP